jgi:hypothetical protein
MGSIFREAQSLQSQEHGTQGLRAVLPGTCCSKVGDTVVCSYPSSARGSKSPQEGVMVTGKAPPAAAGSPLPLARLKLNTETLKH